MCQQKLKGVVDRGLGWEKSRSSWDPVHSIPHLFQLRFCETGGAVDHTVHQMKDNLGFPLWWLKLHFSSILDNSTRKFSCKCTLPSKNQRLQPNPKKSLQKIEKF